MDRPSTIVGRNVARARKRFGLTQAQLSSRCGWTRSKLSQLEIGRASVTVDDLLVLALSLGVSPTSLMAPRDGESMKVEALGVKRAIGGDGTEPEQSAAAWIMGDYPLSAVSGVAGFVEFGPAYVRDDRQRWAESLKDGEGWSEHIVHREDYGPLVVFGESFRSAATGDTFHIGEAFYGLGPAPQGSWHKAEDEA